MLLHESKITFEISFLLLLNVVYSKVLSNFKISWTSNFGSDFSGKLCET